MQFENDLLISYAHIDDQALISGDRGWVSRLHRLLEIRVAQLRGQTPKIWRDPKLTGNDYFAETITERLPNVAALVSVLSPRYVQSEWCNRELKEFCRAAEKTGGVRIADKARIFKVVKTPVSRERLPEEVQPMLGYEFFFYDEAGRPRELAQDGSSVDKAFLTKLDDLAYDIVQLLDLLAEENGGGAAVEAPKATVYLAETTFELRDERESMRRDLVRNGYEVLPDRALPLIASEFDELVREQLRRSRLSIHLVGRNYGIIPEGAKQSIVERQQSLASQLAPGSTLSSLIWLPPGLEVEDERQREFIEHLHRDPAVHAAAELLEVAFEDLKTVVFRTLEPPAAPAAAVKAAPQPAQQVRRVYLLCDQQDVEATRPLEDYLFGCGLEAILPIFDEDEAQARLEHEETLKICDAAVVYYGAAGELWLRRKLREMQRAAALGREAPMLGAIYVGAPQTPQKERFRTLEAMLIHEPAGGFDPAVLAPFLEALQQPGVLP
ncbi:MAG TPA: toll/interleukin-1 receptor domain-containing protein [Thermoanaerobaculia bacterium]|nr:toll/interleukin-1 receptor domain-containing protein [Thermoanaerobaculia bacterium]